MSATEETKLFAQGLDQYIASGDLTTLGQLPRDYPKGEWRTKAESIIEMAEQQRQQQSLLKKKDKKLAVCLADTKLATCQKKNDALAEDIQILEETLKRLKEVLIDTELRAE